MRRLAAEVIATYSRLDVLVNNVGGYWAHRHVTADGLEHTFAVNHLASFLLTNLLLDRLKASAPARVVTVSSGAQSMGRIDFDDLQSVRSYSGQRAYNQSKLANVMFTYELARRLEGTGVTATVLHPGVTRTDFGAEDQAWYFKKGSGLARRFMKSPARGAETPSISLPPRRSKECRASTSPNGAGPEVQQTLVRPRGGGPAVAGECGPRRTTDAGTLISL